MFQRSPFLRYIKVNFPKGFSLAPEIRSLMRWLEKQGQTYNYRGTNTPFLAVIPAPSIDELSSCIVFQLAPRDFMDNWVGTHMASESVIPLVRCGADGSVLAVWRGNPDRYVFLGSEGEAFVVAETAVEFIMLITMGYFSIEMARDLLIAPETHWNEISDNPWTEPIGAKSWVRKTFDVEYPKKGVDLRAGVPSCDPFRVYIDGLIE